MGVTKRKECLETAAQCVATDRNLQYGEPEDNFRIISDYWNDYLYGVFGHRVALSSKDVAVMMALFKIGRLSTANLAKGDSYVDACGYLACAYDIDMGGDTND